MTEVEAALGRVQAQLGPQDFELFRRLANTLAMVTAIMQSQRAMVSRLRRLFGLDSSERSQRVLGDDAQGTTNKDEPVGADGDGCTDDAHSELTALEQDEPCEHKGHGRLPASMYQSAAHIAVPHQRLSIGDGCPACKRGTLYELGEPAQFLRVHGQPLLAATCWDCQRLRCSGCGRVHTAKAPAQAVGPKFDESAVAIIALCRYGMGLPHNRLAHMQQHMKLPIPASTQWDVIHDNAPAFEPVFAELEQQAAQGDTLHDDDSYARVLAFMGERRAELLRDGELPDPERVGLYTTAILSLRDTLPILLFYTGRKYAGENLAALLSQRDEQLEPPVLMADGLESRNEPEGHAVIGANCNAHGRRNFVEQLANFPRECRHVLEQLREIYRVEALSKQQRLSPQERLLLHQQHSEPVMTALKARMEQELADKRVEPNSGLGKAYKYMLKRWDKLTLFLRKAGAPLDNNACERALKLAIRHRRNSLFYRSERGAEIGDMFMSLIYTAELRGENPFEYLTAVLQNEKAAAQCAADWLPWTYRATLARMEQRAGPDARASSAAA